MDSPVNVNKLDLPNGTLVMVGPVLFLLSVMVTLPWQLCLSSEMLSSVQLKMKTASSNLQEPKNL